MEQETTFNPVQVFRALGDETRYELFTWLTRGEIATCCDRICLRENGVCVTDVVKKFGLAQSTVSYHLKVLEEAGLIRSEKRGLWTCFFPNREVLDAAREALRGNCGPPGG
ncbi:MAG: winged helix-turn-helix transcriptional regulator [Firmicutes bacterium]|nr:winged helix-turn-helix transcriptional regulator [Bacillota bacterium]